MQVNVSLDVKNQQLPELYNACLERHITVTEYRLLLAQFETEVQLLSQEEFASFGEPLPIYGLWNLIQKASHQKISNRTRVKKILVGSRVMVLTVIHSAVNAEELTIHSIQFDPPLRREMPETQDLQALD
jgi:hypothetical protein